MSTQTIPTVEDPTQFITAQASNATFTSGAIDTRLMKELWILIRLASASTPVGTLALVGSLDGGTTYDVPIKLDGDKLLGTGFTTFTGLATTVAYDGTNPLVLAIGLLVFPPLIKMVDTRSSGGTTGDRLNAWYYGKS